MISQAQAIAVADRWLNPYGPQAQYRQLGMHEFELGWVVWAVPPPPERDPVTGQRRPPAEVGAACGVVDRRTAKLTVWPSVPVEEVVRMYQQKHSGGDTEGLATQQDRNSQNSQSAQSTQSTQDTQDTQGAGDAGTSSQADGGAQKPASGHGDSGGAGAAVARPVTGPGNTAVFSYVDPANGEETNLFKNSAPGLPHSEYQAMAELQRLGVPAQNVIAVHTDLSSSLLPGGYPGELLREAFPNAQFSCTQSYGKLPEERAEAVSGLLQHVELMHQIAGRQAPPRPHRAPVPENVTPVEPMVDSALAQHLTQVFGPDGIQRYDAGAIAGTRLPEAAKAALTWAGLPADLPFFFKADRPDAPPPGGMFADAASFLRAVGTETNERVLEVLGGHVRIGSDGVCAITVQCTAPAHMTSPVGQVWAVPPRDAMGLRVNVSLAAYLRSLALLATTRERMLGMDPVAAGAAVAAFQEQLVAIDATALADPKSWWSLVVEQMWHGLF